MRGERERERERERDGEILRETAECFAYCILTFQRIPYLSVFQCLCLLETCVCLRLWHFLVIYTSFNQKAN